MELQIVLSVITTLTTGFVGFLLYRFKKRESLKAKEMEELFTHDKALDDAICALCRDRILQGYRYYKQHGEISAQDLETMSNLYQAYHNLGGNGTITNVYDKILALPIKADV